MTPPASFVKDPRVTTGGWPLTSRLSAIVSLMRSSWQTAWHDILSSRHHPRDMATSKGPRSSLKTIFRTGTYCHGKTIFKVALANGWRDGAWHGDFNRSSSMTYRRPQQCMRCTGQHPCADTAQPAQREADTNLGAFKPVVVDVWEAWKRELHARRRPVHDSFPCSADEHPVCACSRSKRHIKAPRCSASTPTATLPARRST